MSVKKNENQNDVDLASLAGKPVAVWASIIGVETRTLFSWIEQGKIRSFKLGGKVHIRESDLQEFLEVSYDTSGNAMPVSDPQPTRGRK